MPSTIDWSLWGTIIGTVATIVFGIWAILLAKKWEYPGQLTYFAEKSIRLFDEIAANLPGLEVRYRNEPVKRNLILVKGFIANTGRKDITIEMVEKPLTFELADGFRWLEVTATSSLNNQQRAHLKDSKTVEFSLGLLRCKEFLRFEALVEVAELNMSIRRQITRTHRIADTSDMKELGVPAKPEGIWPVFAFAGFFLIPGLFYTIAPLWRTHPVGRQFWTQVGLSAAIAVFGMLALIFLLRAYRKVCWIRKFLKLDNKSS